jgi:hypothetical protein
MPKAETVPGCTKRHIQWGGHIFKPSIAVDEELIFPAFEDALSAERFATYIAWAGGTRTLAIDLYTLNAQLSESLYTPLHMLEVTLRNSIHRVMGRAFGLSWYDTPQHQINVRQPDMLAKARSDLIDAGKDPTPGRMVASLTFGFWTAMLGKEYEDLWQTTLHGIATRSDGKGLRRKDLSSPLVRIRVLRNRIAHHEPILYWDLPKHYEAILELTGWLAPAAADWCRGCSRFNNVYPTGGIVLVQAATAGT